MTRTLFLAILVSIALVLLGIGMRVVNDWVDPQGGQQHWNEVVNPTQKHGT